MSVFDELRGVVETGGRAVVLTIVAGDGLGAKLLVREDGSTIGDGPGELAALAPATRSTSVRSAPGEIKSAGGACCGMQASPRLSSSASPAPAAWTSAPSPRRRRRFRCSPRFSPLARAAPAGA